jgi:hypothetical protein
MSYIFCKYSSSIGITLQLIGSIWILLESYKTQKFFEQLDSDSDSFGAVGAIAKHTLVIFKNQFKGQFIGFLFIFTGGFLQLIDEFKYFNN